MLAVVGMEIPGNKFGDVGGMNRCDGSSVRVFKVCDGARGATVCTICRAGGCVTTWACFDVARF